MTLRRATVCLVCAALAAPACLSSGAPKAPPTVVSTVPPAASSSPSASSTASVSPGATTPSAIPVPSPVASDGGPLLACGSVTCVLGAQLCCRGDQDQCVPLPSNASDDDALSRACATPGANDLTVLACNDSAQCPSDSFCCDTRTTPSALIVRCSAKDACMTSELCESSCRTPHTRCAAAEPDEPSLGGIAHGTCVSTRAHPRCTGALVCGGDNPVCYRPEGAEGRPRCGARRGPTDGSSYRCTSAADCGDGMQCVGARDFSSGTLCAYRSGPAENGPVCSSDRDCPASPGPPRVCARPDGNPPPAVRFCRARDAVKR